MSSRRWDYADNNTKFIGPVHRNFAENIWKTFKKVILYGSYARGDYRDDSDIDIMILLDLSDMDINSIGMNYLVKPLILIWITILI